MLFEAYDGEKIIVILKLYFVGKFSCNLLTVVLGTSGLTETLWKTMKLTLLSIVLVILHKLQARLYYFKGDIDPYDKKYGYFSEKDRLETLESVRKTFTFGYDSYMKYAYPSDELNPIFCEGRGPDYEDP